MRPSRDPPTHLSPLPTWPAISIGSVVAVGTIRADEGVNMSVSTPAGVERLPLTDGDSQVSLDVSMSAPRDHEQPHDLE